MKQHEEVSVIRRPMQLLYDHVKPPLSSWKLCSGRKFTQALNIVFLKVAKY